MHREEEQGAIIGLEQRFGRRFLFLRGAEAAAHAAVIRRTTKAGPNFEAFWEATRALGNEAMSSVWPTLNGVSVGRCLGVVLPRGAYPAIVGVRDAAPGLPIVVTNDGGRRDPTKPYISEELMGRRLDHLFIVDPVIDTGASHLRTLAGLAERGVTADRVTALAAVVHPATVEEMLGEYSDLTIVAADVESRTVPQPDGRRFLADLDDMGALVEEAVRQNSALAMHWLAPGLYQ